MQVFAFAQGGRLKADLDVENKAFLQAIYIDHGGSVRMDVKWFDSTAYELDQETLNVTKRVGEYREMDLSKGKSTGDSLANMAAGKKLPCAQVYVRASWFAKVNNLIKHHAQAVKRRSKAAILAAKAGSE